LPALALRIASGLLAVAVAGNVTVATAAAGAPKSAVPQGITDTLKTLGKQVKQGAETLGSKFARYARKAAEMRKHHDGGDLDPAKVTDFLHKRGIGSGAAKPKSAVGAGRAVEYPVTNYTGGYNWPLEAGIVSSEFGPRWGKFHAGIDIAADVGEPVLAAAPGTVIYAGDGLSGYGKVVIIRSDVNTTTLYAHNSDLDVHEGDVFKQGARIAKVGSSGRSTGPHVHFEIRSGDRAVNPRDRLPANKFIGK
jgi:murein DD-endopeptidase MepM/ murein hydrolase activator NlpD